MRPCTRPLICGFVWVWRAGTPRIRHRDGISCLPRRPQSAGRLEADGGCTPAAEPGHGLQVAAALLSLLSNPPTALEEELFCRGGDTLSRVKAAARLGLTLGLTSRLGAGKEGAAAASPRGGRAIRAGEPGWGPMALGQRATSSPSPPSSASLSPAPCGACLRNGPQKRVTLLDVGEARSQEPSSAKTRRQGDVQNTLGDSEAL